MKIEIHFLREMFQLANTAFRIKSSLILIFFGIKSVKNWINGVCWKASSSKHFIFHNSFCFPFAPLRFEASTNELINEELGIAYPIIDGIPNMIPQAARMTHQNKKQEEMEQH